MTRVHGQLVRVTLGRYPELSLSDARSKAREAAANAREGRDPRTIEAERRRRRENDRRTTFDVVALRFLETYVRTEAEAQDLGEQYHRVLHGPDTAAWRSRPISTICKDDVRDVLRMIEQRGSPAAANRTLAYLSKFFSWCVEEDLVAASPTARVRPPCANTPRDRVLSYDELTSLWRALETSSGPFAPLFKVLLLTGQRRGEVGGMRWDELRDLGTNRAIWDLPPARTKNRQRHLVPLSGAVQDILSGLPHKAAFVFTTTKLTPVSGFSKAKGELNKLVSEMRANTGHGSLPSWTLHDLRRTMVTLMNERLSIAPHVIEAVVNPTSGPAKRGIAGVYNRALYLDERRAGLQAWAALVVSGPPIHCSKSCAVP